MYISNNALNILKTKGLIPLYAKNRGVPKASLYKAIQRGTDYQSRKKNRTYPIWHYVKASWLYAVCYNIAMDYYKSHMDKGNVVVDDLVDFLLDFVYRLDVENVVHYKTYIRKALKRKIHDYERLYRINKIENDIDNYNDI